MAVDCLTVASDGLSMCLDPRKDDVQVLSQWVVIQQCQMHQDTTKNRQFQQSFPQVGTPFKTLH